MIDHFGFPVSDLARSVDFPLGAFAPVGLEYHPGYYAVFRRDPNGHNVEAVHHTF